MKQSIQQRTRAASLKRIATKRRGTAIVEFAIVAPLVFFFFFAAFEFCRVAMIRHTVDNAVYEGCRAAIIPGGKSADARGRAENILNTLGLNDSTIVITPATINNRTPEITMTIDVSLDSNSFVPPQFTGGTTISRTMTMSREVTDI